MSSLVRSAAQICADLGIKAPTGPTAKTHVTPAASPAREGDATGPVSRPSKCRAAFGEYDSIDMYLRRRS